MNEKIEIDQLFHKSWFRPLSLNTLFFLLYFPLGVLLLILRCFIALQYLLLAFIFPPSKLRQNFLRVMGSILGITITIDGEHQSNSKVLVANHITFIDHFAIHLASNAMMPTKRKFGLVTSLVSKIFALFPQKQDKLTKEEILNSETPLINFPEGDVTNGEVGLLTFSAVEIPEGFLIQPVSLKISRYFLNTNSISSSPVKDLMVMLFLPNTHFSLKFFPPELSDDGSWKEKAQETIANSLNLKATKFNCSDKAEFIKKLLFKPPSETVISSGSNPPSIFPKSSVQRMISFQERKKIMSATARQKYIEKYDLQVS